MTRKTVLAIVFWGMCIGHTASAEIIHVPNDYSTIQSAINAAANGDEIIVAPGTYNESVDFLGKTLTLRSSGGPGATTIRRFSGWVVRFVNGEGQDTKIEGFTITDGGGGSGAGGMRIDSSSPTVVDCIFIQNYAYDGAAAYITNGAQPHFNDCVFRENTADEFGAAMLVRSSSDVMLSACSFVGNAAGVGGGAIDLRESSDAVIANCDFVGNSADVAGGLLSTDDCNLSLLNCEFKGNSALVGGGMFIAGGTEELVNCSVHSNTAMIDGGGILQSSSTHLAGCTFVGNVGSAFIGTGYIEFQNSIVWGNSPSQIGGSNQHTLVEFSNVQDGWPGTGNIDTDPMFVQPGTGDLRLSVGSACVDAGNNDALPADEFDLDEDGNTLEPIPIDLAGEDRIQDGIVDMGAYEGEFVELPSVDGVDDLDQGDFAILLPCGGALDVLEDAVVLVTNESGQDNASFVIECIDWDLHPGAGGFGELDTILRSTTSLGNGEFILRIYLPFDNGILQGRDPLMMNMTYLDPDLGDWRLAVAGNTQNSPGHEGPVGDRIVVENSENDFGLSFVLGDYGVFWNPSLQKGFAWANIDHAGDVAFGATLCQEDCGPIGGDGVMNAIDVQYLLASWGPAGEDETCDFDQDGQVGPFDLAQLLHSWGPCSPGGIPAIWHPAPKNWGSCPQTTLCVGDLNNDGQVGPLDLATIFGHWGPCAPKANCAADLDGDETVGQSDLAILLGDARFVEP